MSWVSEELGRKYCFQAQGTHGLQDNTYIHVHYSSKWALCVEFEMRGDQRKLPKKNDIQIKPSKTVFNEMSVIFEVCTSSNTSLESDLDSNNFAGS